MDYLYGEISESEKKELESYLQENPEMQAELNRFRETRSLLQEIPEPKHDPKIMVLANYKRSFGQWLREVRNLFPRSAMGKAVMAVAAGILLFLFAGSVARLHIETSEAGLSISMGYTPAQDSFTHDDAQELVKQIRQENETMLANYADKITEQNSRQLQQAINYFQEQRISDLQLVEQTLDELQQNTNSRIRQTNEYLGEVLQTVSYRSED